MSPTSRSSPPVLVAPGSASSSHSIRAPGHDERLPPVDERIVAPESQAEIVDGRLYRTMGANPPHATQHAQVTHVFAGVLADGYAVAVDMLTRADEETDAAPDISVFPAAHDPATGGRQLEEVAFEVLDTERLGHATTKVEKFAARGVRRLFAVRVASRKVYEWDRNHHDWTELDAGAEIVDRCFRVPVPVAALVDRVLADDTVARALLAGRNRVIEEALANRATEGELRATRRLLLEALAVRGPVTDAQRARVTACDDATELDGWFHRALRGEDAAAILG